MSKNLKCFQQLTHLSLILSGYLLIEISLYSHFISCDNITDIGAVDMSKNLKCLEQLTHLSLNLSLYLLIKISFYSYFISCKNITDNVRKSI